MTRTYRHASDWLIKNYLDGGQRNYYRQFDMEGFIRRRFKFRKNRRPLLNDGALSYSSKGRMVQKRNERRWKRYQERTLLRKSPDDLPVPPAWDYLD